MALTNSELTKVKPRVTAKAVAEHVPAKSLDDAIELGRAAARRWVVETATTSELLHAANHVNTGPQAFQRGFVDGLNDALLDLRGFLHQQEKTEAKAKPKTDPPA